TSASASWPRRSTECCDASPTGSTSAGTRTGASSTTSSGPTAIALASVWSRWTERRSSDDRSHRPGGWAASPAPTRCPTVRTEDLMDERLIDVAGVELRIAEAGRGGRPLLLVHGFTGAKEDFADWLPPLAAEG